MDKLTYEIRKKGLSMPQFCDKILGVDYKAFRARVRQQRLRLSEIKLIIIYTNIPFEELFMDGDANDCQAYERQDALDAREEPVPVVGKTDRATTHNDKRLNKLIADRKNPPPQPPPKPPPKSGDYIESY